VEASGVNVNMRDPHSIAEWVRVNPERHVAQLRVMWRVMPAFRDAIEQAVRIAKQQPQQGTQQGTQHDLRD
jgi:hypothetical protein